MAALRQDRQSQADGQRSRRSWFAPALAVSLAAHAGLAAMLWVERPPRPEAGAVVGVEIVSAAGAPQASAADHGAAPARGAAAIAKPAAVPAPTSAPMPGAPRAATPIPSPERAAESPGESAALRQPAPSAPAPASAAAAPPKLPRPDTASPPADAIAPRPPVRAARDTALAAAARAPDVPPPRALAAPRVKEIALRPPARIPPAPANAPRLAAAARGTERAPARPQTASVPIVAADAAPGAGPETGGTTPPRYGFGSAANPIPRYPRTARENGWEGVVMLTVQVSAGGEALSVGIAKSSGHGLLDASAVDAVRRWRFEPARRAGIPVAGTATVPIRFRLEE